MLDRGPRRAALTGYAGLAGRRPGATGWDLGLSATHFAGASGYDYLEWHAGLAGERWNARLSLSPDYFGQGRRTLYAEVDAGRPLAAPWRVYAHLGALGVLGTVREADGARVRADVRLGVALTHPEWEVRAEWVAAGRGGAYPASDGRPRQALVLALSRFF